MRGNRLRDRGGIWRSGSSRGPSFRGNRGNFGYNWQNRNNSSRLSAVKYTNNHGRDTPGKRLSEDEIGVTQYMNKHEGFNGIIKSRYSDFQVSEINEQGEVAKLTNLDPPEPPAEEQVDEDEDLILSKYNVEILPMEVWDKINKLVVETEEPAEPVEIDVSTMSKEDRTKIHEAVKKAFSDAIVGSTVNIEEKKVMRFQKFKKGVRIDNRVKWLWPGEYVYFIVHKENCDTMDAANRLADRLRMHMKPQLLGYAGTKDRRAKTSQWFSVRRVDPQRLRSAARGLRDIYIGNYSFRDTNLTLGMLKGNKFRIALRNVTADDDVINAACEQLKSNGFLNYYGLQRFGTRFDVPTFDIGRQLLKGNYKQAIDLILQVHQGPLEEALALYKSSGAGAALEAVPRHAQNQPEARLIASLAQRPKDYLTALQKVPRNIRLLYLHSYQSMVWNRCLSERIQRFGLAPAEGDLVAADEQLDIKDFEIEDAESDSEETQTESQPEPDIASDVETKPKPNQEEKQKVPVKVLTQEDVESGRYTIFDVIMPLPGYNIDYPPNMKEYYETLVTKDELTLELKSKQKSYSMSGAYRRIAVRPEGVAWSCARYDHPFADLILSDCDELNGTQLTGIVPDGKYKAVLLTLSLPVSCYATMALRELLKVDTSCDKQASQNSYYKRRLSAGGDDQEAQKKLIRTEDGGVGTEER